MYTVQCRISNDARPELWMEIEIGVDNDDKPFWTLTGKSAVSFNGFQATKGTWDYETITVVGKDDTSETSKGIAVNGQALDGFDLKNVPKEFYRMDCGQVRTGKGFRSTDSMDVRYRMEFLCV